MRCGNFGHGLGIRFGCSSQDRNLGLPRDVFGSGGRTPSFDSNDCHSTAGLRLRMDATQTYRKGEKTVRKKHVPPRIMRSLAFEILPQCVGPQFAPGLTLGTGEAEAIPGPS